LNSYKKIKINHNEINSILDQLQGLLHSIEQVSVGKPSDTMLPDSFLLAVKEPVKSGLGSV
jgi:hypothetical protein